MLNLNFLLMVHIRMFSCGMIQFISCLFIFFFHNVMFTEEMLLNFFVKFSYRMCSFSDIPGLVAPGVLQRSSGMWQVP